MLKKSNFPYFFAIVCIIAVLTGVFFYFCQQKTTDMSQPVLATGTPRCPVNSPTPAPGSGAINTSDCDKSLTLDPKTPIITLLGADPYILPRGMQFIDPGATAFDTKDGTITPLKYGKVDEHIPGYYELFYAATNSEGITRRHVHQVIVEDLATATIAHFHFAYPNKSYLTGLGYEGVASKGNTNIVIEGQVSVFIFTKPSILGGKFNPAAKSLEDYAKDYSGILISTSTRMTLNGIPMLRQRYSVGSWQTNEKGEKYFHDTDESETHDQLRNVFFDGTQFIIVTGWSQHRENDYLIDNLVSTIHLKG